jgi:signal transduction histidine kinase
MSTSASETLCSNLSKGMHAAAQPLTILRASFDSIRTDRMSAGELRELVASSTMEVERVCKLFSYLQQLVSAASVKPELSKTQIQPLLARVTDGVELLFAKDGMHLRSIASDPCPQVLINPARTLQALSSILLVAHALSQPQDTIELIASSSSSNALRVVVQNVHLYVDALNAEQSLNMALAEANIRSQQASLSWSLQPFSVQIELKCAA